MRGFCLEVWGDFACFTRPELKTERMSYDVPTPSAVRAFFEAIFWKPAISWHVQKIEVLAPIRFISVRRNEVANVEKKKPKEIFIEDDRQQRAGLFLRDVKYRFFAEFEYIRNQEDRPPVIRPTKEWLYDPEENLLYKQAEALRNPDEANAKYAAMFQRRAKRGQYFHHPYLGCREFPAEFRLIPDPEKEPAEIPDEFNDKSINLGLMFFDWDYSDPDLRQLYYRPIMENGVIRVPRRSSKEVLG